MGSPLTGTEREIRHMSDAERSTQEIVDAIAAVRAIGTGPLLARRIADLERGFAGADPSRARQLLEHEDLSERSLRGALILKQLAGQIDVVVHTVGILTALPHVLRDHEVVESLSLGAGTGGKHHDLETNLQIAEFKFIQWQRTGNAVRENNLFVDLFALASANTKKRRVLYVVDAEVPLRFFRGGRALDSVLSQNAAAAKRFRNLHGHQFATVREYVASVGGRVEVVDLLDIVPGLR
jgi:hypothetical protein